jgi:very-short-patch-repair endonuclease
VRKSQSNPLHERSAAERRRKPHPLHEALAARLNQLDVEFACEKRIGCYYVDFCLPSAGLVIEIDGQHHDAPRDARRDEVIRAADYRVLRFPHTVRPDEMAQQVRNWIEERGDECQHCHNAPKTGKRFCHPCSQEKQDSYRVKQLNIPPKVPSQGTLWSLWPECKTCGNSGYVPTGFERRFKRCECRAQMPLQFSSQVARDDAERAQWRAAQPPPEHRAFVGRAWQDWQLTFTQLLEEKHMNAPKKPAESAPRKYYERTG